MEKIAGAINSAMLDKVIAILEEDARRRVATSKRFPYFYLALAYKLNNYPLLYGGNLCGWSE